MALYRQSVPCCVHGQLYQRTAQSRKPPRLALNAAQQAERDLNTIRLQAGLPPHKYFHLSAAVVEETKVGPKSAGVTAECSRHDAGRRDAFGVAKSSSMAEAARLRIEEDKRR